MGRVFRPKYSWTRSDGVHVERITKAWYIEYTNASGRWIRRKAGITKKQATDALRKAEADVLSEKNGLPTERATEMRIQDLLTDYLASLRHRTSDAHASKTRKTIEKLAKEVRAVYIRDLGPEKIDAVMARMADAGRAPRTINQPLISIRAMLNWAVSMRKLPYNPLACIKRARGPATRRRRPLNEDEIAQLLDAAMNGPTRRAMRIRQNRPRKDGTYKPIELKPLVAERLKREGRLRALAYRLMIESGLRLNEARELIWSDIDLSAGVMSLRAETTKNGLTADLPIGPGLLQALREYKDDVKPRSGDRVAANLQTDRARRQLDEDLKAAGIEKRNAAGRTVDFHALRHTFGTRLVAAGADIKSVQALMRHASPTITMAIYVHSDRARMTAAIKSMPEIKMVEKRKLDVQSSAS